jgi:hypothetical protein
MAEQLIEEVIQDTYLETQKIFFKEESNSVIKIGSDEYLDLISDFQQSFHRLAQRLANLNDAIEDSMTECSDEFLAKKAESLRPLLRSGKRLIATFSKSSFFSSVKTAFTEYRTEVSCLAELLQDIELRTKKIKEDDEFQSLISQIKDL